MSNVTDFIDQLKEWGQRETGQQRAAMADLRRGLQEFPYLAPHMHRYLAYYAPAAPGWRKQTYYLVAALFARYHSGSREALYSDKGYHNMGSYFAAVAKHDGDASESIERRFNALLTAHPQDLYYHLRQAIAFLHGKSDVPLAINWERLFWDIWQWDDDQQRPQVQEKWATGFWGYKAKSDKEDSTQTQTTN